jgi:hypothetical protein
MFERLDGDNTLDGTVKNMSMLKKNASILGATADKSIFQ